MVTNNSFAYNKEMDLYKYNKEIAQMAEQYRNYIFPTQDLIESLRNQQEWIQSTYSISAIKQLSELYSKEAMNFRTVVKELTAQLTREIEIFKESEPYLPLLEAAAAFRASSIWEQLQQIAAHAKELIGWYEPLRDTWASVAKKLDSIRPSFGIAIDNQQGSVIPNIAIRDYSEEKKESDLYEFPASAIKDVVGIPGLLVGINHEEAIDFVNYLSKYPMLGIKHKVGSKIFNWVKKVNYRELSEVDLFRGRLWESGQKMSFVEDQMFDPPFGTASQGRYNPHGLSTLYFADSKDGAISEIHEEGKSVTFTMIRAKLIRTLRILDLSDDSSPIISLCNKPLQNRSNNNVEYLVPNFLSQCCKYHDIHGFVYQNSKFPNSKSYTFINVFKDSFSVLKIWDESLP
ncbi:MAG: RES family NAD+ phosphorylase [Spirochaetes bacterium]|nr:RES family NAD+ phosphorylase [Spirochaetota bacterium]